ncbi:unnamed protein product [Arctia plantaginis]|uniref:Uncharacterized protein n=1 Tax=Arctia plantaginis TaxID=874455 RepID=A0A8S1BIG5_ARCPL|nr:unnamed protein product [Arctia plantaginis]CAB3259833.1 unnamed protein product [Arctia plantaginis]
MPTVDRETTSPCLLGGSVSTRRARPPFSTAVSGETVAPTGPRHQVFYRGFLLHAPKSEEPAGQPADTPTLLDQALPESR